MPAARPAFSDDLPRVGDTVWVVWVHELDRQRAVVELEGQVLGRLWVKLPLIWTLPANDEKVAWLGWVSGADSTMPSRSMAMISWKYFWASLSHWADPSEVKVMFTTHVPSCVCSAMAVFTVCRSVRPARAGSGRSSRLQPGQQDGGLRVVGRGRRVGASAGVGPRLYVTPPVEALERLDVTSWYCDVQLVGGDCGTGRRPGRLRRGVRRRAAERRPEVELGGLADRCEHLLGVLHPRELHDDVVALGARRSPPTPRARPPGR